MHSFPRTSATGPPRAASRHDPSRVSPAALRIAREADATMSPDGWEAEYSPPGFLAEAPPANLVFSLVGARPAA